VIETHPVEFVTYSVRGHGGKVIVVPFETTVPFSPTLDPLGTSCTHSVMVGPPGVSVTSFGEEIGPATTVIPAMGDQVGPFTTRMRNTAPEPLAGELVVVLVVVVLPAVLLLDRPCIAMTAMTDVPTMTIKRKSAIVFPIALRWAVMFV
jgi:hypothetical protein